MVKLVIPSMSSIEEELRQFEEEPDAFSQNLFVLYQFQDKQKTMINDFIMTLSKVYQEEYLITLEELAREILSNRSFEGYLQETVFLEMFINSEAWQTIQGQGATEIGCQAQFVGSIYDQFI